MRPSVTVVVCAYTEHRWASVLAAVASVRGQTQPPEQLVVVVDHNPRLLDRAREAFPDLPVVPNAERRGLSGARNTGTRLARTQVVAFLDDDAVAEPEWLAELTRPYEGDPMVIATSGLALAAWPGRRPSWFPPEFDWVVGCSYRGLPTGQADVRNVMGAAMSFRRDVIEAAGWFAVDVGRVGTVPLGCEETELSIRAARSLPGARLVHVPSARVRHHVSPDRTRVRYFVRRCYAEGASKAVIARRVGASSATSTERRYASVVLPAGIARGIGSALRGKPGGLGSSAAIGGGFVVTVLGYLAGRMGLGFASRRASAEPVPSEAVAL